MATPINGIYVLQGVVPSDIAAAPVTAKVVEMYDDSGNLLSPAQVAQMEGGGGQVLGYFSIGEAENYRSYFSSLPSSVLGPQDPAWPGDYQVAYWTPQWLTVAEGEIQKMITQGYNGAYFDVVGEATETWAQQNAPGGDAEGAMVKLIQQLTTFAHAQNPNFKIWINSSGAEPMLSNPALINAIDGVFEEQLYYQNATKATSSADLSYNVSLLDNVTKAGKPVVAIEYISGATQVASVESQAKADGFGYYIANPNLGLVGVDTQGFAGLTPPTTPTPPAAAAPTVKITSTGGTVTQAAQTITGTVDVADAGSTVKILDGTTQIGSATVAANGAWSANVTLANQGANVLTATDTNAAGTGTSNAITETLSTAAPTPTKPTVKITSVGGTVTQAAQTITGTVDVADAGSTVKILDGTTQIGSAIVAANGAWSANVTLANQGANVLTATDTNAAGTGTSNAITETLSTAAPSPTKPTVKITSVGGTVTQAAQTITGTVDVADAGSTVKILDGTTQIGSATVAANGAWSANVTLANQGANVLTATDTNAAGTGTSNSITDMLSSTSPTPPTGSTLPTLTIADTSLHVTGGGGTVALGIHETAPSGATSASITIRGLPWYETIKDGLGDTFSGGGHGIRISEAQVNSGLTLTSNYQGTRDPVATLQITANATVAGVASHSATQTLTVIDPPATSTATVGKVALLNQYIAGGFDTHSGGVPLMSNVASAFGHDDSFLTSPRHA